MFGKSKPGASCSDRERFNTVEQEERMRKMREEHARFTTLLRECVDDDEIKGIIREMITKANAGDVEAARFVLKCAQPGCC